MGELQLNRSPLGNLAKKKIFLYFILRPNYRYKADYLHIVKMFRNLLSFIKFSFFVVTFAFVNCKIYNKIFLITKI